MKTVLPPITRMDKHPGGDPRPDKPVYWAVVTSCGSIVRTTWDKYIESREAAMECYGISNEHMRAYNLGSNKKERKAKLKLVRVAPSDYVYLAYTANFWGKGKTPEEAVGNTRDAGGERGLEDYGYTMFRVHPDTYVEAVHGDFVYPKGHAPIQLYNTAKPRK